MKNRAKLVMICGFALTTFLAVQQNVKADTIDSQQIENVNVNGVPNDNTQVAQSTVQDSDTIQNSSNNDNASSNDTTKDASVNTEIPQTSSSDTQGNSASTQADSNATNVTQIDGVVQTNKVTYLYTQDGSQVKNRALGANTPWITDRMLNLNGSKYYRVATNEYTNSNDVTIQYGESNAGVVRVKQDGGANYKQVDSGFIRNGQPNQAPSSVWKYNKTDNSNGLTYYQIANNDWLDSDDATIAPAYQNPNSWLQIQNTQIQPSGGSVGYDLYNGVEGIKTYLVRKYFGYSNSHTIYDSSVASSVRNFQSRNGLAVTGIVNLDTWKAMGYSEADWYGIDSYVAPLQTSITSTRSDHIEAMIKYMGKSWVSGAASMPAYGVDCSGLVTQALYATGIDSAPISNIQHAQPGHEWNSRDYWADNRLPRVNFNSRQRGDLIFFADPSTGVVWHVGILLNADTMIESWPFAVQEHSIYSSRGTIVGVKRVFS
ncbi:peptidoglycan-binding protein [Companilactobacillus allii]|uniref:NlpC/P60 domain-containing protein n=1 Tax=Companilactobacillus allii TaxID=1847728 RepID=A0A1P8Q4J8_9LACO|nr:peptidoglycan-binding protein [Companilactobacillus allii]APX72794.1 hypothetical protein BTM29_09635 [Companilactobacillus allii]USQ67583.1 peptidoglycan-binding protein [Companilactobacillus allii]